MPDSTCLEAVPWETRNLGIESFAVSGAFFAKPYERVLKRSLEELGQVHGSYFVQARFKPDTKTSQILEANGFYFVEATVSPSVALSKYVPLERFVADPSRVLPGRYDRSELDVAVVAAGNREMEAVRTIAGESFVDDRFHVDHNCRREAADQRYVFWVESMLSDRAVRFHLLRLRHQPIAFMASKGGSLLLAGFARRYAGGGLGEFFWLRVLEELRLSGVNGVRTVISVSNTSVLNLYARLAFKFGDPRSTFHLWGRPSAP